MENAYEKAFATRTDLFNLCAMMYFERILYMIVIKRVMSSFILLDWHVGNCLCLGLVEWLMDCSIILLFARATNRK